MWWQIAAGSTWHFQCWYRDPGVGPGYNLSDGLTLVFTVVNVIGAKDLFVARRGDGIRVWGTTDARVERNEVTDGRDVEARHLEGELDRLGEGGLVLDDEDGTAATRRHRRSHRRAPH